MCEEVSSKQATYKFEGKVGEGAYGVVYKATQIAIQTGDHNNNNNNNDSAGSTQTGGGGSSNAGQANSAAAASSSSASAGSGSSSSQISNATRQIVAVKKFKDCNTEDTDEETKKALMREVKMLRMLKHNNIVTLLEAFQKNKRVYFVFEYMNRNLLEILEDNPHGIDPQLIELYSYQLIEAIEYMHTRDIIHRDIKPENLLVNLPYDATLKLCDFGFARQLDNGPDLLTDYVATRWYRSPELLIGFGNYSKPVDIWAIGTIIAEMIDSQPLFPGTSDLDQLILIRNMMGSLTKHLKEMFLRNPSFVVGLPKPKKTMSLEKRYHKKCSGVLITLVRGMLEMDEFKRLNITQCRNHSYFERILSNNGHYSLNWPAASPQQSVGASSGGGRRQIHGESVPPPSNSVPNEPELSSDFEISGTGMKSRNHSNNGGHHSRESREHRDHKHKHHNITTHGGSHSTSKHSTSNTHRTNHTSHGKPGRSGSSSMSTDFYAEGHNPSMRAGQISNRRSMKVINETAELSYVDLGHTKKQQQHNHHHHHHHHHHQNHPGTHHSSNNNNSSNGGNNGGGSGSNGGGPKHRHRRGKRKQNSDHNTHRSQRSFSKKGYHQQLSNTLGGRSRDSHHHSEQDQNNSELLSINETPRTGVNRSRETSMEIVGGPTHGGLSHAHHHSHAGGSNNGNNKNLHKKLKSKRVSKTRGNLSEMPHHQGGSLFSRSKASHRGYHDRYRDKGLTNGHPSHKGNERNGAGIGYSGNGTGGGGGAASLLEGHSGHHSSRHFYEMKSRITNTGTGKSYAHHGHHHAHFTHHAPQAHHHNHHHSSTVAGNGASGGGGGNGINPGSGAAGDRGLLNGHSHLHAANQDRQTPHLPSLKKSTKKTYASVVDDSSMLSGRKHYGNYSTQMSSQVHSHHAGSSLKSRHGRIQSFASSVADMSPRVMGVGGFTIESSNQMFHALRYSKAKR